MLGIGIQQRNPDGVSALFSSFIPVAFGALTRASEGGFPVSGASIVEGDPSGHWQISNGALSPSVAGEDAISGSYELILNDDTTLNVSVVPDAATVANADELFRYGNGTHTFFDGGTVSLRPGDYDIRAWRGRNGTDSESSYMRRLFTDLTNPTFVESAEANNRAVLNGWRPQGDATADIDGTVTLTLSELHLRNVIVRGQQSRNSAPFWGLWSGGSIVEFFACRDCSVTNCEIEGDILGADEGGFAYETLNGVTVEDFKVQDTNGVRWPTNSRINISNNRIRRVQTGISVQAADCIIANNEILEIHGGDFLSHQADAHRAIYQGNLMHTPNGDQTRRHPDGFQQNSSADFPEGTEDLLFERNQLFALTDGRVFYEAGDNIGGPRVVLRFSNDPIHEFDPNYIYSTDSSITLDLTHANCEVRLHTPDGGTLAANLPTAASAASFAFCIRGMTAGGTYPLNFQPGEGHEDAVPASIDSDGFSAVSDGSLVWRSIGPQRMYFEQEITGDFVATVDHCGVGFVMGLSGSAESVTLPLGSLAEQYPWVLASASNDFVVNVRVFYPGQDTYTVNSSGGDQIQMPDGSLVSSFSMEHGKAFRLRWLSAEQQWRAESRAGAVQPIFGNGPMIRPTIRYNLLNGNAPNGILMQGGMEDGFIHDNVCFNAPEVDEDQITPFVLRSITNDTPGTSCLAWRNVVIGGDVSTTPSGVGSQPGVVAFNYVLNSEEPLSAFLDTLGGQSLADLRAATPAEAIEILRPLPTSAPWLDDISALGPNPTEGRLRADRSINTAEFDTPAIFTTSPPNNTSSPETDQIEIQFNHPVTIGTGLIEIARVDTGEVLGSFDVATSLQLEIVDYFTLRLTHGLVLPQGVEVEVRMSAGAVVCRAYGTSFPGLASGEYVFTSEGSAINPAYPVINFGQDIPAPENFRYLNYQPGGTQTDDKFVFAFSGTPVFNEPRASLLFASNLEVRVDSIGRLFVKVFNYQVFLSGVLPPVGTPIELFLTWDGAQLDSDTGLTLVINGSVIDTSGLAWSLNRTLDLNGADFSVFFDPINTGRNLNGPHLVTFFDQPATLPDITQLSVRDRMDALTVGQAYASGDWSQTLTARQPQVLIYGDATDITSTLNRGTGSTL